jgi:erythronate-4-phosphate dehydrogenase
VSGWQAVNLSPDGAPLKIVADEQMPALQQTFAQHGQILTLPGREIRRQHLQDADILLVRSVTRVDRHLLQGTPVRFVGTATSGTDHVDIAWLQQQGMGFADAAGCNARAVVEYVITALTVLAARHDSDWRQATVGIIGAGNIGGRLAKLLTACGVPCLIHDPFLPVDGEFGPWLQPLPAVLACEVVTLHVPLTDSGPHPTRHMIDAQALRRLPVGAILINAARGGVVDEAALLACLQQRADLLVVIDAWVNEPRPNPALIAAVDIATPHVAGHSRDAKRRGTIMLYQAFLSLAGQQPDPALLAMTGLSSPLQLHLDADMASVSELQLIRDILLQACPVLGTDGQLRAVTGQADPGAAFDSLRRQHQRLEFSNYQLLDHNHQHAQAVSWLQKLGFQSCE